MRVQYRIETPPRCLVVRRSMSLSCCQESSQDTRLRMPDKWHICKEGQAVNKKRQRRGLLVISELPSLPSAGSRSGCFHTSLGFKQRSLIQDSLGWFDYSKYVGKEKTTPAYSPVSDRSLTALACAGTSIHHKRGN
jgi:hypothetical protein